MQHAFVLRLLPPCETNLKKRIVKSPKLYVRDTGLLHALLDIRSADDLFGHPTYGSSWEGLVVEELLTAAPDYRASFLRLSTGAEVDLVLERGQRRIVWLVHTLGVVRHLQEQVHGVAELHCDALSEPLPTSGSGSFHTKDVSTSIGAAV